MECVRYCIKSGVHHKLDPSIDNGKWFASKVLKESSYLQENGNLTSPPFIPSTGRRAFPSNNIPSLFNYGHVHYYALESISVNSGAVIYASCEPSRPGPHLWVVVVML